MVAVIGADGSGKSTVLSSLAQNFRHKAVRDIYILNRFSRKIQTAGSIKNYNKLPRSSLVSIVKLVFYTFYWIIKFHFKIAPMRRRGTLILCDHFYFLGLALDPLKYRYGGPPHLPAWIMNIIPQPDIYILLDGPCELLYQRKQEVNFNELKILINKHRKFILEIENGYVIDAAESVEDITVRMSEIIVQAIERPPCQKRGASLLIMLFMLFMTGSYWLS